VPLHPEKEAHAWALDGDWQPVRCPPGDLETVGDASHALVVSRLGCALRKGPGGQGAQGTLREAHVVGALVTG
jgi:hypothetical protein